MIGNTKMKKFELYSFDFLNSDGTFKSRPVLVLEDGVVCPVAEITSHDARTGRDYKIIDWKGAGLTKPSIIRFDKIQIATNTTLKHRIGKLSQVDITNITRQKLI